MSVEAKRLGGIDLKTPLKTAQRLQEKFAQFLEGSEQVTPEQATKIHEHATAIVTVALKVPGVIDKTTNTIDVEQLKIACNKGMTHFANGSDNSAGTRSNFITSQVETEVQAIISDPVRLAECIPMTPPTIEFA